ncbi:MAG: hypothetical protein A2W25_09725 [candidate division Zixibacteria bacterium RBG_16_53_22]|nr:MAG: hypothetical protein A2W25_09725 [candidate division Zixibacteria bacterium RBG_16_53_22]
MLSNRINNIGIADGIDIVYLIGYGAAGKPPRFDYGGFPIIFVAPDNYRSYFAIGLDIRQLIICLEGG